MWFNRANFYVFRCRYLYTSLFPCNIKKYNTKIIEHFVCWWGGLNMKKILCTQKRYPDVMLFFHTSIGQISMQEIMFSFTFLFFLFAWYYYICLFVISQSLFRELWILQTCIISFFLFYFRKYGFRLGLQSVTGVLSSLFFLGLFYRSASLYHPQRRAILHLKDMSKRKGKDKDKIKNKPPYFDLTTLKAKPFHIILLSTAFATFGVYTPLFFFVSRFIFIFNGS